MRPVLANPPLCTMVELKTTLTIDDLADMHEALNMREAAAAQAQKDAKKARR